ncbi:MAG TPA: TetR family transcriptional regulator [Solirubrobacteraceae bacterium]
MAARAVTKVAVRRGRASSRVRVSEMQRSRLLSAAVATIEELGWPGASVGHITARARVSRRTFYDLFENREDCLLAVLDDVVERVERELAAAGLEGLSWRERVRGGLWTILCFLDREPVLARVCVAQALQGGPRVLERRERVFAGLAMVLDEGRRDGERARGCPPLMAEGLVGAVFAIVYARLSRQGEHGPLGDLLGELTGMIVLPYLGPAVARREQDRPPPPVPLMRDMGVSSVGEVAGVIEQDPLRGVPMRLTYRTVRVLEVIGANPGVSNRVVGELAGVADQGQISKLLARLERLGLIENTGAGHARGEVNSWSLRTIGEQVLEGLGTGAHTRARGKALPRQRTAFARRGEVLAR